jgi:hypothetical protein
MKLNDSAQTFTGKNTMRCITGAEMGDIRKMGSEYFHVE